MPRPNRRPSDQLRGRDGRQLAQEKAKQHWCPHSLRKGEIMRRGLAVIAIAATGLMAMPATAQTTHTCFGEPATLVGTAGNDELRGDVVVGLGGSDELHGRLVCSGKGNDGPIDGDMGADGGPGDDSEISGDALSIGGPGNDEFFDFGGFGSARQVWRGGPGDDAYNADEGDDVFYGGAGNDGTGDDQEGGFTGDRDVQYGGSGNDRLAGGLGRDKLFGGDDDDRLRAGKVVFADGVEDLLDGGAGFDTCVIHPGDRAVNCEDVTVMG